MLDRILEELRRQQETVERRVAALGVAGAIRASDAWDEAWWTWALGVDGDEDEDNDEGESADFGGAGGTQPESRTFMDQLEDGARGRTRPAVAPAALPVLRFRTEIFDAGSRPGAVGQPARTVEGASLEPPESCAICLGNFVRGETVTSVPGCGHRFHHSCLQKWMAAPPFTCPLCRVDCTAESSEVPPLVSLQDSIRHGAQPTPRLAPPPRVPAARPTPRARLQGAGGPSPRLAQSAGQISVSVPPANGPREGSATTDQAPPAATCGRVLRVPATTSSGPGGGEPTAAATASRRAAGSAPIQRQGPPLLSRPALRGGMGAPSSSANRPSILLGFGAAAGPENRAPAGNAAGRPPLAPPGGSLGTITLPLSGEGRGGQPCLTGRAALPGASTTPLGLGRPERGSQRHSSQLHGGRASVRSSVCVGSGRTLVQQGRGIAAPS